MISFENRLALPAFLTQGSGELESDNISHNTLMDSEAEGFEP